MDAYIGTKEEEEDALFMEIERRLLLLITEGEEEDSFQKKIPNSTRRGSGKDLSILMPSTKLNYSYNSGTRLSVLRQPSTTAERRAGTGVFIPHTPSASPPFGGQMFSQRKRVPEPLPLPKAL